MSGSNLRVRSAPSPSNNIHLGNLRTFLFNYLVAKQNGGSFVLRMEDSDPARSKKEYCDYISNTMKEIGLTPDEGYGSENQPYPPYMQSQKSARYKDVVEKLISDGFCYKCYCTQDELDLLRKEAEGKNPKAPFKYSGKCRDLKEYSPNKPYVVRLKVPSSGNIILNDKVFGKITFPCSELYDAVIARSNDTFLFNLTNVVDDIDHKITLVIRGRDHTPNYPYQALIYQALGAPIPEMAHLPLILDPDGSKVSKRSGGFSVNHFVNELGYSPMAVLNYMSRFGFSCGNKEVFDLNFLIENFDINNCKKSDGKFSSDKFLAINGEHLKNETLTPTPLYAKLLKPFIDAKHLGDVSEEALFPLVPLVRFRAKTFVEAADILESVLKSDISPSKELIDKTFTQENKQHLQGVSAMLASIDAWNEAHLRSEIQNWLKEKGLSLKDVGGVLRVSLLGTPNSPELFQVLNVLGKEQSLTRINKMLTSLHN